MQSTMHFTQQQQRFSSRGVANRLSAKRLMCNRPSVRAAAEPIQLQTYTSSEAHVAPYRNGDLNAYIRASPEFFQQLTSQLPDGGKLDALDMEKGLFELTVPKIKMFDLWIQPRAVAVVRSEELADGSARLTIHACQCKLTGSHHVEKFNLNKNFELDVRINFTSQQLEGPGTSGAIHSEGAINVQVDVPPPFRFMPRSVLKSTGSNAMHAMLSLLLASFVEQMARDYNRWAAEQEHLVPLPQEVVANQFESRYNRQL